MLKAGDPFIPCSLRCGGLSIEPVIDERWQPSKRPPETHVESASPQGVHDDVMLALRFVERWQHFASRDELPEENTLRQAVLWARLLDKYLTGKHVAESTWLTFAELHLPMGVSFHGKKWSSYHFAAAHECQFWLSVYEQAALGYYGTLSKLPPEKIVADAVAAWPKYVERAKQFNHSPMVRIKFSIPDLITACEVEFRRAVEQTDKQAEATSEPPALTAPSSGATPVDEASKRLSAVRLFAQDRLRKAQRAVVELVCDGGGKRLLKDIATDERIGWDASYSGNRDSWRGVQTRANQKLRDIGEMLKLRDKTEVVLEPLPNSPRKPRKNTARQKRDKARLKRP